MLTDEGLEGDITVPGALKPEDDAGEEQEFNTLDEPVKDTIVSDTIALFLICLSLDSNKLPSHHI